MLTPAPWFCRCLAWFCGGRWDAAQIAVFEPVAVSLQGDDVGVVHEAVDHGGGDGVVAEDLAPAIRGWHMFVLADLPCCLRLWGSSSFQGSLRFEGRMLGGTLIFQV